MFSAKRARKLDSWFIKRHPHEEEKEEATPSALHFTQLGEGGHPTKMTSLMIGALGAFGV